MSVIRTAGIFFNPKFWHVSFKYSFSDLLNICSDKFEIKSDIVINFRRHVWWHSGVYSEKEVKDLGIFNKKHPENSLFIKELKKIDGKPLVSHNFHNIL